MRVLVLTHGPFPPDVRIEREISTLRSAGFEVMVIANRGLTKTKVDQWKGALVSYFSMAFPFGLPIMNFLRLVRVTLSARPAIIQVCDAPLGLVAIALSKLTRTRLIYDAHEIWPLLAIYGFSNRLVGLIEGLVFYVVEFLITKTADRVLTVGFGIASLFERYYGCSRGRIVVVRNLPSMSEIPPTDECSKKSVGTHERFLIVFVGGIDGQRRRELAKFIDAVNILKKQNYRPQMVLRIVGGESVGCEAPSQRLYEQVCILGCPDVVEFLPWVAQKEAMEHVLQADLCIIASEKNPYSEISFPNKILQYIARGKPVLSSKLLEIQDTFGDAVLYYENSDPTSIANSLVEICDRKEELSLKMLKMRDSIISILNWENESLKYVKAVVETSIQWQQYK